MIKKLYILVVISVLAISTAACSKEANNDRLTELEDEVSDRGRPSLNLSYQQDGKEVTSAANRGGYSCTIDNGDGTKTSEKTDSAHILQWSDELMPVVVMDNNGPTLKVTLQFHKKATNCKIIAWEEKYFGNDKEVQESYGKEIEVQSVKDGENYNVEVSPGYIYEVKAEGEEWSADFGFRVVESKQNLQASGR